MLEEQNLKKDKENAKARNQALMERLFQIEESLLNHDENKFKQGREKKVDFGELMKGQQLYQKQLIDTLIAINKKPKSTVKPTVYLPVPIRDPHLLPADEGAEVGALPSSNQQTGRTTKQKKTFGDMWDKGRINQPTVKQPTEMADLPVESASRQGVHFASQPRFTVKPPSAGRLTANPPLQGQVMPPFQPANLAASGGGLANSQVMQGSVVGNAPGFAVPDFMKPNVLRIYKKKKADHEKAVKTTKQPRDGPYRISRLRKYAIAAHFIKKLWINQVKANLRYRKESRIFYEEHSERVHQKTVKFLRQSLSEVLDKIWSLEVPLSFTRRKKLYALYSIDTNSMGPIHWETINVLLMSILDGLNKYLNDEFLDPEICSFFGRFCCDRSFLKDNHYYESMLDRLEFDSYEGLA